MLRELNSESGWQKSKLKHNVYLFNLNVNKTPLQAIKHINHYKNEKNYQGGGKEHSGCFCGM